MYDERSEQYDENSVHVQQAQDYVAWAELKQGDSLLDLACGTGLVAWGAKRQVGSTGHVVGIDISKGMLDVARRKAKADGLEVRFIDHDISDLSDLHLLPDGSSGFDVITCASALILLPNPLQAVQNWKLLLRPGGRIITDVQTKDANVVMNIFASIAPQVGESVQWEGQRWQSQQTLADVMTEAGLDVQKALETRAYATTHYDLDQAHELFDQAVSKAMFKNFGREAIRQQARSLFVDKFAEMAGSARSIDEETRYWVVVAAVTS